MEYYRAVRKMNAWNNADTNELCQVKEAGTEDCIGHDTIYMTLEKGKTIETEKNWWLPVASGWKEGRKFWQMYSPVATTVVRIQNISLTSKSLPCSSPHPLASWMGDKGVLIDLDLFNF